MNTDPISKDTAPEQPAGLPETRGATERSEEASQPAPLAGGTGAVESPALRHRTERAEQERAEKAVRLVAKLYEARDFVRRMTTPDEYRKRIAEYQGYIRQAMTKWNLDEIAAMMKLATVLAADPYVQAALFAAYVEMVEPEKRAAVVEPGEENQLRSNLEVPAASVPAERAAKEDGQNG